MTTIPNVNAISNFFIKNSQKQQHIIPRAKIICNIKKYQSVENNKAIVTIKHITDI